MAVVGPRRAPLRHRLPLRRAGAQAEVDGFDRERAPQEFADGARRRLAGRARCGSASRTQHLSRAPRTRGCASCCPTRVELVAGRRASSRPSARSRSPARSSAIRAAAALADDDLRLAARARARRAHRARGGARARARDAPPRRRAARASPRSSPRPSTARCRTPSRATSRSPRDTLVTLDLGARLDGYCSDCTRTWATGELDDDLAEVYDARAARAGGGAGRRAARARRAARSTRSRATDRRGGPRRALRPRARPRRRARGPRGAAARAHRRATRSWPATS